MLGEKGFDGSEFLLLPLSRHETLSIHENLILRVTTVTLAFCDLT